MVTESPAGAHGDVAPSSLLLEELAIRADVDTDYVRRLIELGALESGTARGPQGSPDVCRVQLLRTWEAAGFQSVVDLVRAMGLQPGSESLETSTITRARSRSVWTAYGLQQLTFPDPPGENLPALGLALYVTGGLLW